MRIAICEDEVNIARFINEKLIASLNKMNIEHHIDIYNNGYDLLDSYFEQYDVLFLDIFLGDINGFEIAQKIRECDKRVVIIFLTAGSEYVFDGYKVDAFRYILKDKFVTEVDNLMIAVDKNIKSQKNYIIINNKYGFKKLLYDDILYVTSNLRKIIFYTQYKNNSIYGKLCDFEKQLLPYKFIRTHQSYLVNSKYIKALASNNILLDNDILIPVSRIYLNEVKMKVMEYLI